MRGRWVNSRNACCPFTVAELRCAMNKLKIGKVAGADEISNEMLKIILYSMSVVKVCVYMSTA